VKQAREEWKHLQATADPARLVFLDESGAKTNMTRLRGRAKGGRRCVDDVPHGHWCATTMISSVRLDGTTACMAIDGATSAEVFREYVRQVLVPALRPGDVVIFDNLSAHKDAEAAKLIRATGATALPLPAYSPDLNPIEKMWSKVKEFLRAAKARTFDTLLNAIAAALETVTAQDAQGWFQSCGYTTSHS
jgi:transposase